MENKELRAIELHEYIEDKRDYFWKKYERARKREIQNKHYEKYKMYRDFSYRSVQLVYSIRSKDVFGKVPYFLKLDPKKYTERRQKEKEEKRIKFENTYRIALWFYSESLTADYGTHHCDKCSSQFHHSPSEVYLGAKKQYSNACGYCVNNLLDFNRQETIFC